MFDALLSQLETDLRAALGTCVTRLVATARERLKCAHADVAKGRAEGLAEVAEERAKALAEIDTRRAELGREIKAMHMHREAQEGRVELNIGGYRFETSVQTLRRVPHTFFDAYFSGRYAQDVCNDGSIFVDRDGEHFGHVLEYMRSGVVAVAEDGACPSVNLLRSLKREFGFYCIALCSDEPVIVDQLARAYVIGGSYMDNSLSSMEQYDVVSGQWKAVAAMSTARYLNGACAVAGEIYVSGGVDGGDLHISSVEKYSPSTGSWSAVAPLPEVRVQHSAVGVGSAMYVLGGVSGDGDTTVTSVHKFDSAQGTWIQVAPMPESRCYAATCAFGSDIFVFGGMDTNFRPQHSVFKYDTVADEWSILSQMPCVASRHCASVLGGVICILGTSRNQHDVLQFDPISGIWSMLAPTLCDHWLGSAFVLGEDLYAAGGSGDMSAVERYDVATNTWTTVADMLERRSHFCAVTIGTMGPTEEQDLFDALIAKASN